jgi:hypothetical protein
MNRAASPSGYSGTPLAKKLGIGAGARVLLVDPPPDFTALLAPLPDGVRFETAPSPVVDLAHVFATRRLALAERLAEWRAALRPDAVVWVSWPKKSARVASEITEDAVRELALPLGFVDVKVCAIDATWSGLKLVVRKPLR